MSISNVGRLVVVVGASGAGKDSILRAAQKHFNSCARVEFVKRVITRECDPATEVHDSVSEQQFIAKQQRGDFSVWWRANGLYYGLPIDAHEKIAKGQLLIANGSRAAIEDIRSSFKPLTTVHITASESALLKRLERRNRESKSEIVDRLNRNRSIKPLAGDDIVTIDNSGEREVAINEFIALVESF